MVAAFLALLVAWSCWHRWSILSASPFPVGIDGYFYPIQLRGLLEDGALVYPASPLAFWLMLPFAAATDPITGAKLGAAVFGALIALPAYGVGARVGASRGAGLVAAVLATTSAGSAFLTFEFVKNGVGLTLALTALWLLLRALDTPSRGRIAAAIAGGLAAVLTHKVAAALVVAIAVPAILAELAGRGVLRGRRLLYVLGALALVVVTALVLGLVFPERFLSPSDLALIGSSFTGDARWDAPALVVRGHVLTMGHEAAIGGVLALLAAATLAGPVRRLAARIDVPALARLREAGELAPRRSAAEIAAAWVIVGLALAIALPWLAVADGQGLGFRLRIVAFVPMALCAAIVARTVYLPIGVAIASLADDAARWPRIREAVLIATAAVLALAAPRDRTDGMIVAHPAMVSATAAVRGRLPAGDVAIVPERHIAFMVAWYARVPVRLRPEPVPRERRWRVMPLAFIGARSPLDQALMAARDQPSLAPPIGVHPRHPNGLVLVPEATWDWVLAQLPPRMQAHYARWPTI